jgi:hypothetical protein
MRFVNACACFEDKALRCVEPGHISGASGVLKIVGVDGPTASSASIGLLETKTGAVHDPV